MVPGTPRQRGARREACRRVGRNRQVTGDCGFGSRATLCGHAARFPSGLRTRAPPHGPAAMPTASPAPGCGSGTTRSAAAIPRNRDRAHEPDSTSGRSNALASSSPLSRGRGEPRVRKEWQLFAQCFGTSRWSTDLGSFGFRVEWILGKGGAPGPDAVQKGLSSENSRSIVTRTAKTSCLRSFGFDGPVRTRAFGSSYLAAADGHSCLRHPH